MAVLGLGKIVMYDAFYNKLKKFYGDLCELLYTDTDRLIVKIQTQDFYKDIKKHPGMFDTSKYVQAPIHIQLRWLLRFFFRRGSVSVIDYCFIFLVLAFKLGFLFLRSSFFPFLRNNASS